ncbi:MAG: M23 family metallopeptidase [Deltaproteobacteria bacterium]|nr:M23 family metallopeptidase [Deltaproteobacteria bacterium]
MKLKLLFISILASFILPGCFVAKGVFHTVGKGETFWRICKTYEVDPQEVAELNGIKDPSQMKTGAKVFIPGVTRVRKVKPYVPPSGGLPTSSHDKVTPPPAANHKNNRDNNGKQAASMEKDADEKLVIEKWRFIWPVQGEIESQFGMRSGTKHDGIDIRADEGAPIKAADDGRVVYSNSKMRGYGNLIIIKHKDDFYTAYAHNKTNHVKDGDKVSRGDVIGTVGSTGNASNPHLHFEVRHGQKARNPIFFLP